MFQKYWERLKSSYLKKNSQKRGEEGALLVDIRGSTKTKNFPLPLFLFALVQAFLWFPPGAWAQTGGDAVGKFKDAAEKITKAVQQISGISVLLLLVVGFALLMWGGISETFRIRAIRIIGFSVIGGACLFLFAQPLADFLTSTFGAGSS